MDDKKILVNTRERILAYLRENRTATVVGLNRAWGLTRADIRYHLNALIHLGQVEVAPRDPTKSVMRGRPVQSYRLKVQVSPSNYPVLCSALLSASFDKMSDEQLEEVIKGIVDALSADFTPAKSITQRYNQAIAYLNEMAYRARWEASAAGPRFILRHCPYAAILDEHPSLCDIDRHFLERIVQIPLIHQTRIDPATGSPPACVFLPRRSE